MILLCPLATFYKHTMLITGSTKNGFMEKKIILSKNYTRHFIFISDFQKAAAFIHEFMLKLQDDSECAELRDSLNLALLHMQKYYRVLQHRNHEKNIATSLSLTARGLSPMTPFVDAPDKFQYKWINLDSFRLKASMGMDDSLNVIQLPPIIQAAKSGSVDEIAQLINDGKYIRL